MQWDDVRVLLALLRARNLQGAGARLGLDRSTISRRLTGLERQLGVRLFVRAQDGLRPTAAAERLRPPAERMELEALALAHAVAAGERRTAGVVRVATTDAFAAFLVTSGLLALRDEHPDLVIEVLGGNQSLDLARGEADIAVRLTVLKQASLRARCVVRMGIGLFAAPSYRAGKKAVRPSRGLRGHDVLLPAGELSRLPEAKWLASRPGVCVVFRSNSMPALVAAAVLGQGIVPLPLGWGDSEPGLERLSVIEDVPKRPVWLVTHEGALERPAVRLVADHIGSIFARAFAPHD